MDSGGRVEQFRKTLADSETRLRRLRSNLEEAERGVPYDVNRLRADIAVAEATVEDFRRKLQTAEYEVARSASPTTTYVVLPDDEYLETMREVAPDLYAEAQRQIDVERAHPALVVPERGAETLPQPPSSRIRDPRAKLSRDLFREYAHALRINGGTLPEERLLDPEWLPVDFGLWNDFVKSEWAGRSGKDEAGSRAESESCRLRARIRIARSPEIINEPGRKEKARAIVRSILEELERSGTYFGQPFADDDGGERDRLGALAVVSFAEFQGTVTPALPDADGRLWAEERLGIPFTTPRWQRMKQSNAGEIGGIWALRPGKSWKKGREPEATIFRIHHRGPVRIVRPDSVVPEAPDLILEQPDS